ncbi:hypothetical protein FB45DRAFT_273158 [Roridomyces roridus]|uniref:MYND-type domain-containing protein n=1 Tax=Roridomyces roridus TaxID=1738132 RepID=A0AAD7B890_9AGAR|nr:hypothetical protein FB45DRAFT_273158 [Roridomyces roridus]
METTDKQWDPPSSRPWRQNEFFIPPDEETGFEEYKSTWGTVIDKVPSKPALKRGCESLRCGKRPDQEPEGKAGFPKCAGCGVVNYCSRECQKSDWKEHKGLCKMQVMNIQDERAAEVKARLDDTFFISNAELRKWYHENVDVVDHAIVQTLQLYKGRDHSLWRTHIVVFELNVDEFGIEFINARALPLDFLTKGSSTAAAALSHYDPGKRIIVMFLPNGVRSLTLIDNHEFPREEEWAGLREDERWRLHCSVRPAILEAVEGGGDFLIL